MNSKFLDDQTLDVAVVGAGPAGLMAAEVLSAAGRRVHVFDAMPSVGRKFLMAGKGGLNLTHSEPLPVFMQRYGERQAQLTAWIDCFSPDAVRAWAAGLGVETFVGTSGRIFPSDMKAAPLLRHWLQRLRQQGVQFHMRHRWTGGDAHQGLHFDTPQGAITVNADAVVLALGGASWPRFGSDGSWLDDVAQQGVEIAPWQPANSGFDVAFRARASLASSASEAEASVTGWTSWFAERYAGQPFKSVAIALKQEGQEAANTEVEDLQTTAMWYRKGEFVATSTGVEGSVVYAASALLRNAIARQGYATLWLDLLPDWSAQRVLDAVRHPRGSRSLSSHLKSRLGLDGIKAAVLHEVLDKSVFQQPEALARAIKALPLHLQAARPVAEAISSAGGVRFEALDEQGMLRALPGVFCAGEMLDWEAPTGGYLLTACFASGAWLGRQVDAWLHQRTQ